MSSIRERFEALGPVIDTPQAGDVVAIMDDEAVYRVREWTTNLSRFDHFEYRLIERPVKLPTTVGSVVQSRNGDHHYMKGVRMWVGTSGVFVTDRLVLEILKLGGKILFDAGA